MIVAVDDKGGIARDGVIPWRCTEDMEHFKNVTMGKAVLMGRKTYDSIGKALCGRTNYVLTRDSKFNEKGCIPVGSEHKVTLDSLIKQYYKTQYDYDVYAPLFVIGGAEVYKLLFDYIKIFYITVIPGDFKCTTFFPRFYQIVLQANHGGSVKLSLCSINNIIHSDCLSYVTNVNITINANIGVASRCYNNDDLNAVINSIDHNVKFYVISHRDCEKYPISVNIGSIKINCDTDSCVTKD